MSRFAHPSGLTFWRRSPRSRLPEPEAVGQSAGMRYLRRVSRALKDAVCRYKTMVGYLDKRKAGWDTHGLFSNEICG